MAEIFFLISFLFFYLYSLFLFPFSTLPLESFPGSPRITPDLGWGGGRLSRRKIGQECRWDPGLEETLCGGRRPLLSADAGWGSAWCGVLALASGGCRGLGNFIIHSTTNSISIKFPLVSLAS